MLVPDGWSATRSGNTYELTREGDDGAAHISVYTRLATRPTDADARQLVDRFLTALHHEGDVDVRVLDEGEEQRRAVARCISLPHDGRDAADWLVFLVLWPEHSLMCSYVSQPGSGVSSEAEWMFSTIHRTVD